MCIVGCVIEPFSQDVSSTPVYRSQDIQTWPTCEVVHEFPHVEGVSHPTEERIVLR